MMAGFGHMSAGAVAAGLSNPLERLAFWQANGDTDHAFGWSFLKETQAGISPSRAQVAAE
jgi:hypothetical protein